MRRSDDRNPLERRDIVRWQVLVMNSGGRRTFALRHRTANTFFYQPRGENAVGISAVTFRLGSDGRTATMNVEFLAAQGLGTSKRTHPP
jgi:hypothetical protein